MIEPKSWRDELAERIDELCDLRPYPDVTGINRAPVTWWKNEREQDDE